MLHPTLEELNQAEGTNLNRYEMAMASAKCARKVTDGYVEIRQQLERDAEENKEPMADITKVVSREVLDCRPVTVAVRQMMDGEYRIVNKQEEQ